MMYEILAAEFHPSGEIQWRGGVFLPIELNALKCITPNFKILIFFEPESGEIGNF